MHAFLALQGRFPIPHGPFFWPGIVLLGLGVGVVAGMFGVGGGFLLTPLLHVAFQIPMRVAVGTGLCQMIGTAAAAYRRHQRLKQGEVKIDWIMLAGSLLGVKEGADLVALLSSRGYTVFWGHRIPVVRLWLSIAYIILLAVVGIWMLYDARIHKHDAAPTAGPLTRLPAPPYTWLPRSDRRVSVAAIAYLGFAMGFLSGLLGIGGGVALMPILIYGIGMTVQTAAGTGILMLVATSVTGTVEHARMGHVNLLLAVAIMAGSTVGAPIGATLTSRIRSYRLRGLFAGLVFLAALAVLWSLVFQ